MKLADLVANGTLSAEMGGLLAAAAARGTSFLTVAVPRFAGKSTLSQAVLGERPQGVPLHVVDGSPSLMEQLRRERLGGYLVVPEFSRAPVPGYIWGAPVRRVFETLDAGYSLQASLHAASAVDGVRVVTDGNGVPDAHASVFALVLYIERLGEEQTGFTRRLAEVYEMDGVRDGEPHGRMLFRWDAAQDRFEQLATPRRLDIAQDEVSSRADVLLHE